MEIFICGIDPGLASGGIVFLRHGEKPEVLASKSLVEARGAVAIAKKETEELVSFWGGWGDKQFIAASLRSERWVQSVVDALDAFSQEFGEPNIYAIESFVDQPSRARSEKQGLLRNRWQTPLSTGRLAAELLERGAGVENGKVVYQNAGIVIPQMKQEITAWAEKRKNDVYLTGDTKVKNDHERKALAHALALSIRLRGKEEILAKSPTLSTRTVVELENGKND